MSNAAETSGAPAPAGDRLVIGIGRDGRGDDAAGLEAVRRLGELGAVPCVLSDGEPTRLLELFGRAPRVWVVDAVRSGAAPGTLYRFEGTEPPPYRAVGTTSTHGLSLGEAIALGRALDRLPGALIVHGIEAGPVALGDGLSLAVARAIPRLVARVRAEIDASGGAAAIGGAGPRA